MNKERRKKQMKVFIVYCHPSEDSFTRNVRDAFIKGIVDSGNEYVMSDLYKMNFKTDMSEKEYLRDSNYSTEPGLESDVLAEQTKINSADAIVFIYRVKESDFIVFDGMSKARDSRKTNWDKYLDIAYRKGYDLCIRRNS